MVEDIIKDISIEELENLAKDRNAWKGIVDPSIVIKDRNSKEPKDRRLGKRRSKQSSSN